LSATNFFDAEADLVLLGIHIDDYGFHLIPYFGYFAGLLYPLAAQLGNVHQSFDPGSISTKAPNLVTLVTLP